MLAVGVAGVVVPAVSSPSPVGAVEEEFTLSMVEGGGLLELRDQEPYAIEQPTAIDGSFDPDTGLISDASFATPVVSFEFVVETPPATAFIEATFSEVDPGTGSGTIDSEGNVLFEVAMAVALDVEVVLDGTDFPFVADVCEISPIELQFGSTAPYDISTGRVTLADPDFAVPEITSGCHAALVGSINEALAGGGHALTLTLEGDIPLPPPPGEPSVTTLSVTPEDTATIGDTVVLEATVEPGAGAAPGLEPTGFVEFRRGSTVLATLPLIDGAAEFDTTSLPVGTHTLTARYRGDADFAPSSSEGLAYTILATPLVTVDLPSTVLIGGDPVEFDVTVTNTGLGSAVANARIDVTLERAAGSASTALAPATGAEPGNRVALSRVDSGGGVEPISLTAAGQRLLGTVGEDVGEALAPGATLTERLRLELPDVGVFHATNCGTTHKTCPGPLRIIAEVVLVDPITGAPAAQHAPAEAAVANGNGVVTMVEAQRRETEIQLGFTSPFPGFPTEPPVYPHTSRPGRLIVVHKQNQLPSVGGLQPTGPVQILIDGVSAPFQTGASTNPDQYVLQEPGTPGTVRHKVVLPADISPGEHVVTMRTIGDAIFAPAEVTATFHVDAAVSAPLYDCVSTAISNHHYPSNLVTHANLPAVSRPGELQLGQLDLRLLTDRGPTALTGTGGTGNLVGWFNDFAEVGSPEEDGVYESLDFSFGPAGSGMATGAERTNYERMDDDPVGPGNPVDQVLDLHGETGSVIINGEPGDVIPVTVDRIQVRTPQQGTIKLLTVVNICEPFDEEHPAVLGEVTIAGTLLSASASSVQPGHTVTLDAEAIPAAAGIMVFSEGETTLDVVPTAAAGTASSTVSNLAIGSHDITAQFFPTTLGIPSTTSDPVTVTVVDMDPAFSDVPEDSMFFMDIQWLAQEGITTGFEDGSFQPAAAINRDAVAAWLWRYAGEPVVDVPQQFSDVPPEHPFYDAIQWLADAGITTGFSDGTFQPASAVSRDAVAAWLWRFAGEPEPRLEEPAFIDVLADHPFYLAVQWLAETEVTTGFPDGTFQPAAEIERQAVAAWLFRLAQL